LRTISLKVDGLAIFVEDLLVSAVSLILFIYLFIYLFICLVYLYVKLNSICAGVFQIAL